MTVKQNEKITISPKLFLDDIEKHDAYYQQYVFDGQGVPYDGMNGDFIS